MASKIAVVLFGLVFLLPPQARSEPETVPVSPLSADASVIDAAIDRVDPPLDDHAKVVMKTKISAALKGIKDTKALSDYLRSHPSGEGDQVGFVLSAILKDGILKAAKKADEGHGKKPVPPDAVPPQTTDHTPAQTDTQASDNAPPQKLPGYDLGRDIAQQQYDQNPADPNASKTLGLYDYYQHDYKGAFGLFDQAIRNGDNSADLLTRYSASAYHLGDYQTAAAAAKQALKADPSDKEAMALYHLSKDVAPKVNLPTSLGELAQGKSPESMPAGAMVRSGNGASSNGGAIQVGNGAFLGNTPSGMTAEQVAEAARQAVAPGSDSQVRSAQFTKDSASAIHMNNYQAGYDLASQAFALNPQNVQALNYRAISLSRMNRYSDAVQDASAALGLSPGNANVLATRSWAFSKEKKYKEGLEDAQAASAAEPLNGSFLRVKAFALAGTGDRQGALDALRRSAALDPTNKTILERALQLPQDKDLTLLFDDPAAAVAEPPTPGSRQRRFLRLAVLSTVGGLLIALGVLHVVSASWRDRMRMTVRRVLGPSAAVASDATVAESPSMGSFWTQYDVIKEIGLGGMGVVYEATDRSLERRVAVKKMRDEIRLDPDDRRRFVNEARLVAQLHHPNIVDIYGIVEDGMDVYLVFEFVEGRTLQDALKSGGPMDLPKARRVLKEMADAVEHAHGRSVIHRDLKPSNVMITPEGRVKVMDFGIARQAKDSMTRHSMTNTIAGTPPYMAPEQEQGTVRKESDVYALGVCLYEMTTGFLPFTGSGAAMLLNKLNGKLIPPCQRNPSLPAGLDAVIARALEPDPDKRYHTAAELVAALESLSIPASAS
jgi:tetratricopeptide (TPR) repeat protein